MKRKIIILLSLFIGIALFLSKEAYGTELVEATVSTQAVTDYDTDERVIQLRTYLKRHNSPLAEHAATFVEAADYYQLPDWRLVPAISGVESTFGKHIPYNSYNAYGWVNGKYSFDDWDQSIVVVTKTLKERYVNRGLDTVEKIAPVYAPPSTTWAGKVLYFMNQIDKTYTAKVHELSLTL